MPRPGIIGGVLLGILILGVTQESFHPLGSHPDDSGIVRPTTSLPDHPNDVTPDTQDVREPTLRHATSTSANTVPAPVGVELRYAPDSSLLLAVFPLLWLEVKQTSARGSLSSLE